ncbi:MAG TPA: transposase [Chlamydiales bacterium]|nr:transposase [Chlamydiales bacterium]
MRQEKKLNTYLQRIVRELYRKLQDQELKTVFKEELEKAERLLAQQKNSKNKLYSIHEPEVECVCKGKSQKKYEFGCKAALVVTHKEGLVLSASAEHGVPYDGHTLSDALEKAERVSGVKIEKAFVDKGYKGHGVTDKQIIISGQKKGMTKHLKKQLKRRQAIEPHIGHMKSEGKLNRNYLAGKIGDQLNAILVGIGHNLRMLFRMFREPDRLLA